MRDKKPITADTLDAIKKRNRQNDAMLAAMEAEEDTELSAFTIASMGVDFVDALLAEVERLQAMFAWYAGIDSDDAAWDGLDKLWAEQGITASNWRQAIDEVAEQGREVLRRKAKG